MKNSIIGSFTTLWSWVRSGRDLCRLKLLPCLYTPYITWRSSKFTMEPPCRISDLGCRVDRSSHGFLPCSGYLYQCPLLTFHWQLHTWAVRKPHSLTGIDEYYSTPPAASSGPHCCLRLAVVLSSPVPTASGANSTCRASSIWEICLLIITQRRNLVLVLYNSSSSPFTQLPCPLGDLVFIGILC